MEGFGQVSIRTLLKDKSGAPALAFYHLGEHALSLPEEKGRAVNALEHVWGYFSDCATTREARKYQSLLDGYLRGETALDAVKRLLYRLSVNHKQDYLLGSYYFTL